jgi:hypothetical protein
VLCGPTALLVQESCAGWIETIAGHVWDEKAALLGRDGPGKADGHNLDAGRYAIKTQEVVWRPLVRGVLGPVATAAARSRMSTPGFLLTSLFIQ